MIPDLKDCTLEQRQQYYYNAAFCIYCKSETEYVSSLAVYQEDYGFIHLCKNKSCGAYVSCIPFSDQSLGTTANKKLRTLRIECHNVYDPLIEAKVRLSKVKRKQAQADGRKWLSEYLNLDVEECHIAYLTEENCQRLIEKCKSLHPTPEQIEAKKKELEYYIGMVEFLAVQLEFEVKRFNIMGNVQLELKRKDGKVLFYNHRNKQIRWNNKKKPTTCDDIEQFILKNFKLKDNGKY